VTQSGKVDEGDVREMVRFQEGEEVLVVVANAFVVLEGDCERRAPLRGATGYSGRCEFELNGMIVDLNLNTASRRFGRNELCCIDQVGVSGFQLDLLQ